MKSKLGKVLLLLGPSGSGKSTIGQLVAQDPNWEHIEEDAYWAKRGWVGLRTTGQETAIQQVVFADLHRHIEGGLNVVLDFIIYENPPYPLLAYEKLLKHQRIDYSVVALRPSLKSQLSCLDAEQIMQDWVVDTTNLSPDEVAKICVDMT